MPFRGTERRLRARFRIRIPFVLRSNGHEVRGITRNVSLLGISAYTDAPMPQVQPVQCVLELPKQPKPLIANGTVIRCESLTQPHPDGPYEMGVFFKGFPEGGEPILSRFLDQLAREDREAIKTGYRLLQQRVAERRRRKRLEAERKRRRRLARLRRRRLRLAREKRLAAQRRAKRRARTRQQARTGKPARTNPK